MATLLYLATAASAAPPAASAGGLTADQAMANYRAVLSGAIGGAAQGGACRPVREGEILVCKRDDAATARLPLRDARAEPGEAVHHIGEPPPAMAPGRPATPSRLGDTIGKGFGLLKGLLTGEDRGF